MMERSISLCLVFTLFVVTVNAETLSFRSPMISLRPGEVVNNFFYPLEMPSGHLGLRRFTGEMVDEEGNSAPLTDVYLHHWNAQKVYAKKPTTSAFGNDHYVAPNDGTCQGVTIAQFFGLGAETRRTENWIPDPYVIEVGNPEKVPDGYEEKWMLNVHAIELRGTVNPFHCLECQCAAYNSSVTGDGDTEYLGGSLCCLHGAQCELKEGFPTDVKHYYFQYTVDFLPMVPSLRPVKVYHIDVTDDRKSFQDKPRCKIEYDVLPAKNTEVASLDQKLSLGWLSEKSVVDVVYVAGHVHPGGVFLELKGEDEKTICKATAVYGTGHEAGNETGHVVGVTACYPEVGTVKIKPQETLHLRVVYDNKELHTGVMGIAYVLVAEPVEQDAGFPGWKLVGIVLLGTIAGFVINVIQFVQRKRRVAAGYQLLFAT